MVGRWLLGSTRVALLDEPFRGVDIGARHEIGATVRALTETAAVLVATSDLDEALEVGDRIVVLNHGRLAADLPLADATRERLIRRDERAALDGGCRGDRGVHRSARGADRGGADSRKGGRPMTAQVAVAERHPFSGAEFVVRYGVILVGILIAVAFALLIPGFATPNTLVAILQTQAVAAIAALGMTLTAVVADLDLSVGAVAGLSVTVAALVMVRWALTEARRSRRACSPACWWGA